MDKYDIDTLIRKKFGVEDFNINDLESTLFAFAADDYIHPTKRIAFPLTVVGLFGKGSNSIVIEVQDSKEETFSLRLSPPVYAEEINVQNVLAGFAMAPELFYVGRLRVPGVVFSIMEIITGTLGDYISSSEYDINNVMVATKCLLDKKFLLGFVHGDMHLDNIALLKDGKTLGLIDFEWSFFIQEPPFAYLNILDFIPFLGSLRTAPGKANKLFSRVKNYYDSMFKINIEANSIVKPYGRGYQYKELFSYIKNFQKAGRLGDISVIMMRTFPTLTLPEIVD